MTDLHSALLRSPIPRADRVRVLAVDAAITSGVLLFTLAAMSGVDSGGGPRALATAMIWIAALSLILRRVLPVVSALTVAVTGLVILVLLLLDSRPLYAASMASTVQAFAIVCLLSLYAVTVYASALVARLSLGTALAAAVSVVAMWKGRGHVTTAVTVFGSVIAVVLLVGVWSMGRVRRARLQELRMLAERNRALEAERESAAERAATDERTRIAREMHDIVAHSLSAVIAQADGGRYAAHTDPAAGVRSLETISTTARAALSDMRALLGVLRDDEPRDTAAPRTVADVATLVAEERTRGADVSFAQSGRARDLPAALGLSAYRIAQEALTNVRVHAPDGTRTRVETVWMPGRLTLVVEDVEPAGSRHAPAAAIPSGGRGILGMRERAALHRGTLEARSTSTGFRVTAVLPLPESGPDTETVPPDGEGGT